MSKEAMDQGIDDFNFLNTPPTIILIRGHGYIDVAVQKDINELNVTIYRAGMIGEKAYQNETDWKGLINDLERKINMNDTEGMKSSFRGSYPKVGGDGEGPITKTFKDNQQYLFEEIKGRGIDGRPMGIYDINYIKESILPTHPHTKIDLLIQSEWDFYRKNIFLKGLGASNIQKSNLNEIITFLSNSDYYKSKDIIILEISCRNKIQEHGEVGNKVDMLDMHMFTTTIKGKDDIPQKEKMPLQPVTSNIQFEMSGTGRRRGGRRRLSKSGKKTKKKTKKKTTRNSKNSKKRKTTKRCRVRKKKRTINK